MIIKTRKIRTNVWRVYSNEVTDWQGKLHPSWFYIGQITFRKVAKCYVYSNDMFGHTGEEHLTRICEILRELNNKIKNDK